jgi:hypothetical protein
MSENVVNGWRFPPGVDVPEDSDAWHRIKQGGEAYWVVGHDILIDVAHQLGLNSITTEVVHTGSGMNDVPHAAVSARVEIDGRPVVSALGSIDETGNSLADMISTAETKAVKRALKRSMNVTNPGVESEDPDARGDTTQTRQGGRIDHGPDGDVDVTPPGDRVDDGARAEDGDFGGF